MQALEQRSTDPRFQVPADLTGAVGHVSHPRFPLGLRGVHQALPWSWRTAHVPTLSYRVRPGRFTSWSLGSPPLPPASEVLDFLFHASWARPFSRLPRPILVGDQQHLLGLAKSCPPNCELSLPQLWVLFSFSPTVILLPKEQPPKAPHLSSRHSETFSKSSVFRPLLLSWPGPPLEKIVSVHARCGAFEQSGDRHIQDGVVFCVIKSSSSSSASN